MRHDIQDTFLNILIMFSKEFPLTVKDIWEHYKYEIDEKTFHNNINLIISRKYIEKTNRNDDTYFITDDGIAELKIKYDSYIKSEGKKLLKEEIEERNLFLQYHNLNIEKKSKEEISRLTIENLKLQNRKLKREIFIAITSFVLGLIVNHYKDNLLQYLPKIQQQSVQSDETNQNSKASKKTYQINMKMDTLNRKKNGL